jgi:hypothetical protein
VLSGGPKAVLFIEHVQSVTGYLLVGIYLGAGILSVFLLLLRTELEMRAIKPVRSLLVRQ